MDVLVDGAVTEGDRDRDWGREIGTTGPLHVAGDDSREISRGASVVPALTGTSAVVDLPTDVDAVRGPRQRRRWHGVTRPLPSMPSTDQVTGDDVWAVASAVRSLTMSVTRFRAALADALEISPTDVLALAEVALSPGLTPGELADRIAVGVAGTSTVIDRLVRAGFLRRTPSPIDRRTYTLTLSPAGVHAVGWTGDVTRAAVTEAHAALAGVPVSSGDTRDVGSLDAGRRSEGDAPPVGSPPTIAATVTHLTALSSAYYRHANALSLPQ